MAQAGSEPQNELHVIQERADATKEYLERKYAAMRKQREGRMQRCVARLVAVVLPARGSADSPLRTVNWSSSARWRR